MDQDAEPPCLGWDRTGKPLSVGTEAVVQGDDFIGDPVAGEDPTLLVGQDQTRGKMVERIEGDLPLAPH